MQSDAVRHVVDSHPFWIENKSIKYKLEKGYPGYSSQFHLTGVMKYGKLKLIGFGRQLFIVL